MNTPINPSNPAERALDGLATSERERLMAWALEHKLDTNDPAWAFVDIIKIDLGWQQQAAQAQAQAATAAAGQLQATARTLEAGIQQRLAADAAQLIQSQTRTSIREATASARSWKSWAVQLAAVVLVGAGAVGGAGWWVKHQLLDPANEQIFLGKALENAWADLPPESRQILVDAGAKLRQGNKK